MYIGIKNVFVMFNNSFVWFGEKGYIGFIIGVFKVRDIFIIGVVGLGNEWKIGGGVILVFESLNELIINGVYF